MTQISYQPAYDAYHSLFRLVQLLYALEHRSATLPFSRICSFFIAFPHFMTEIRYPREIAHFRRSLSKLYRKDSYVRLPSKIALFENMRPFHDAAVQTLVVQGYVEREQYIVGYLTRTAKKIDNKLLEMVRERNEQNVLLFDAMQRISAYPLDGVNGIKHRTGLMEHRYDSIHSNTSGASSRNSLP
ncbi:hypothetical protein FZ983_30165 [Azospirillum sp. B21]|uniref:ABC-three component system middle component 5 n=1 Tax=Azospirillum sp. B21 TaxID=2607496 RepID=UPI0011EC7140|nr:ABC-three component system middle component 5 [Azospirillum sp. B21]KAA0573286.1 hypothetical protein FZ983_30165 [Azospirillum sp. B21]